MMRLRIPCIPDRRKIPPAVAIPRQVALVERQATARLLWAQRAAKRRVRAAGCYTLDRPVPRLECPK